MEYQIIVMTDYDILGSSLVLAGCLAKRKHRTINRRVQKKIVMEQFHHFGTVFAKEDRVTGKVAKKPCLFIAKFHYNGPDRTRPDPLGPERTRTDFVGDPHGPNGVSPQKKSVRVRSGLCSGI